MFPDANVKSSDLSTTNLALYTHGGRGQTWLFFPENRHIIDPLVAKNIRKSAKIDGFRMLI